MIPQLRELKLESLHTNWSNAHHVISWPYLPEVAIWIHFQSYLIQKVISLNYYCEQRHQIWISSFSCDRTLCTPEILLVKTRQCLPPDHFCWIFRFHNINHHMQQKYFYLSIILTWYRVRKTPCYLFILEYNQYLLLLISLMQENPHLQSHSGLPQWGL